MQILARAYYASRDTSTPVALTLVSIGANVILSVTLAPVLGINGLALANSIATLAEAALLLAFLAPRARLRLVGLGYATLKQVTAALFMGVGMFLFIRVTNTPFDLVCPAVTIAGCVEPSKPVLFIQTLIATAFGGALYVAAAYLMRIAELQEVLAVVRTRFRRGPVVAERA